MWRHYVMSKLSLKHLTYMHIFCCQLEEKYRLEDMSGFVSMQMSFGVKFAIMTENRLFCFMFIAYQSNKLSPPPLSLPPSLPLHTQECFGVLDCQIHVQEILV